MRSAGGNIECREVRIVSGNGNGPTFGVDCLGRVAGPTIQNDVVNAFIDGCESDVVVQELAVLHQHERIAGVKVRYVRVHDDGH